MWELRPFRPTVELSDFALSHGALYSRARQFAKKSESKKKGNLSSFASPPLISSRREQGCQILFWRPLEWKMLVYFLVLRNI
jgi:hypothetical protein